MNELPDLKTRLDTILTLWKKCDGYIVLIENGTNAGFKLIEEARDFLIQQAQSEGNAYLFAPVSIVPISIFKCFLFLKQVFCSNSALMNQLVHEY